MENSPILVSALQFAPKRGNVDFNLLKINELAGGTEAKLLVLPELASTTSPRHTPRSRKLPASRSVQQYQKYISEDYPKVFG